MSGWWAHPSEDDESGNFEFVGAMTDITERKRAETKLQRVAEDGFRTPWWTR